MLVNIGLMLVNIGLILYYSIGFMHGFKAHHTPYILVPWSFKLGEFICLTFILFPTIACML